MKTKNIGSSNHGTQEWSVKTINFQTGCIHGCLYCYAKAFAVQRKQLTASEWAFERIRSKDVAKRHRKYDGQVMLPSSHDLTPNNIDAGIKVLGNLIDAGNQVLVVSKPHFECIERICQEFSRHRDLILFRFSIGACDDRILSYWEPGAPSYDERKACLEYAYNADFRTSVSVEPMLDSANIDLLIEDLSPYVTHSIWIGTMNHLGRLGKNVGPVLKHEIDKIRRGQTDKIIMQIYSRYKNNPMIKWKKEIKKVVGIPIPKQNGLDI